MTMSILSSFFPHLSISRRILPYEPVPAHKEFCLSGVFPASVACWGFRLCVSVKSLETILTGTDAIKIKLKRKLKIEIDYISTPEHWKTPSPSKPSKHDLSSNLSGRSVKLVLRFGLRKSKWCQEEGNSRYELAACQGVLHHPMYPM